MKSLTSTIVLLPLSFCLLLQPLLLIAQTGSTNTNELLTKVCEQTEDKDLCSSSLMSDPQSQKADLSGLAMIALNVASDNASRTCEYIQAKLDNPTLGPLVLEALDDCMDEYLDVSDQLEDSIAALLANANKDIRVWVEAALADVATCENAFKKVPGKESLLTNENNILRNLLKNILVINKMLAHK